MVNESAIRPQRVESIQEVDGAIPSTADFLPFADVVDSADWTPDITITPRRGIGTVDQQKFDRGTETHTFTLGYDLQGAIAEATASLVKAEPVYEGLIRTPNQGLERRSVLLRETHANRGAELNDRHIFTVARHSVVNSVVLSGDPASNSPVAVELEYITPRTRSYILDQPGRADILNLESSVSEALDVSIRGEDETGAVTRETVSLAAGYAETVTPFQRIYAIEAQGDHAGDITVTRDKLGLVGDDYEWASSGSGTAEFYLTAAGGGDPALVEPDDVFEGGSAMVAGTAGTLAAGEWDWADNDTLGFTTIYVRLADDADPDTKAENYVEADQNQDTVLFKLWGNEVYDGIEGDYGIPLVPTSGSRRTDHGGTEQRFLNNTLNRAGSSIADKINSAELEVANNVDTQAFLGSLGEEIGGGGRDVTISATVFGKNVSDTNIDEALRGLVADIVWSLTDSTLTVPSAIITDSGSRARDEGNVFANQDVEFTGKSIEVS